MNAMNVVNIMEALGYSVVLAPALLLAAIGVPMLIGIRLSERRVSSLTNFGVAIGLLSGLGVLITMLLTGERSVPISVGHMFEIPQEHFHFSLKLLFDRLSIPFVLLTFVLCGVIGAFARAYLHRDTGYRRFFLLLSLFQLGMILSSVAGTIETLFLGWELVGLSSALLVAFFQDREGPVINGLKIWVVYRIADAAFLLAALLLHHLTGGGDFNAMTGQGPWPFGTTEIDSGHVLLVGLLLLIAAAGKSALVPFSGWLPRAMEGPTPSSAVFYGALSVHLGAFLLLRISPLLDASLTLRIAVVLLGLITAVFATLTAHVQTDVKSALAFASLTQVSLIVMEIGFGLRYFALCHIIGHACMRTLQLLRAPSILRDNHARENDLGSRLPEKPSWITSMTPEWMRTWLYTWALERGGLDTMLMNWFVRPFLAFFYWSDRMERRGTAFLSSDDADTAADDVTKAEV